MVIIANKQIRFSMSNVEDLKGIIPVGVWLLKFDEFAKEFLLEKQDDFIIPDKVYGDTLKLAHRYLNTFKEGSKNLGVALTGLKGTGKSLLAKQVCVNSNLPVILITDDYSGSDFNSFLANIKQEAIIFIDEFEKVYEDRQIQESFLSILDGVFMGKKLFLFTSNETSRYSNYLINRPGRVHYMKTFERISDEILDDILNENLNNKSYISEFKEIINLVDDANIDMVFALVSECNRYKENPRKAVQYLNIRITTDTTYEVFIQDLKNKCVYEGQLNHSPLLNLYSIYTDMNDECWEKLSDKQQNERSKYPFSKNWRIASNKFKVEQKGREITLSNKEFILKASPMKDYGLVF